MKIKRKRKITEPKEMDNQEELTQELTPLEKARLKRDENRRIALETGVELKRKNPMEAWEENRTSLRKSVNAKCYDCNAGELYKNRTRYCTIFDCPLWHVRPYSSGISKEDCLNYKED